jgi:hypothetical protein
VFQKYKNALKSIYPTIPDPPLPLALPLEKYTGTYYHPGYRNITLVLKKGKLHCDRDDASWKVVFDLEHVSGENFIAYIDSATAPGLVFKEAAASEFVIGSDGVVSKFGFNGGADTGPVWIWFERI